MKIAVAADHAGFALKEKIKHHLMERGFSVEDCGTNSADSVDYPDFAQKVGERVAGSQAERGILVCGTGIGMCMAANKLDRIRAAKVDTEQEAVLSREHNDANVLTLGARVIEETRAFAIVDAWFAADFLGGRHQRRVDKIMGLENLRLAR